VKIGFRLVFVGKVTVDATLPTTVTPEVAAELVTATIPPTARADRPVPTVTKLPGTLSTITAPDAPFPLTVTVGLGILSIVTRARASRFGTAVSATFCVAGKLLMLRLLGTEVPTLPLMFQLAAAVGLTYTPGSSTLLLPQTGTTLVISTPPPTLADTAPLTLVLMVGTDDRARGAAKLDTATSIATDETGS